MTVGFFIFEYFNVYIFVPHTRWTKHLCFSTGHCTWFFTCKSLLKSHKQEFSHFKKNIHFEKHQRLEYCCKIYYSYHEFLNFYVFFDLLRFLILVCFKVSILCQICNYFLIFFINFPEISRVFLVWNLFESIENILTCKNSVQRVCVIK